MLAPRLQAAFAAVADTLLPEVPGRAPGASDLRVGDRLAEEIWDLLPADRDRRDLEQVLRLMDSGVGSILLFGMPGGIGAMKPEERVAALRRMARSPLGKARLGFKALKALAGLLYMNPPRGEGSSPVWEAIGYPGPHLPEAGPPSGVVTTVIEGDTDWECDVVIVGSGAGGAVAAGVLAAAGLDVVVLERGPHREPADFGHREIPTLADVYLQQGLGSTADGGVSILAGSALGGGTVVNYTTSFTTPEDVREEWDRVSGLDGVFTGTDFDASLRAVLARLGVNRDHDWSASRDQIMEAGAAALGWHTEAMPRNVEGCRPEACGWCGLGCRLGAKRSMLATYLADASAAGARIVAGADVRRVDLERGRAIGVSAQVGPHRVAVRSRAVVLAAGALMTPVLMQRSGVRGRGVGANLRLHPATVVWGRFSDRIEPWTGIMQSRYSDEFSDLDGTGYGFRFETAPAHPSLIPLLFGWDEGGRFAGDLLDLAHWSPLGLLLRDRGDGRVTARSDGSPVWRYRLSTLDTATIALGVARAAELFAAAGAEEVMASTLVPIRWRPGDGGTPDGFADDVESYGLGANRTVYLSFHQMGSARMGKSARDSAVGPENETHRIDGLYVLDGSTFPTASGVNPMITIAAIAHRGATALAATLS